MIPQQQRINLIPKCKLVLATSLVIFGCTQVVAQPNRSDNVESTRDRIQSGSRIFAAPPPPSGIGAPRGREGRGSRGCEIDNQISTTTSEKKPLLALVPVVPANDASEVESVGGFTTAERPTFWFYLPYQPPLTGKFVLRDRDENLVYETNVTLPGKPGAYAISLPTTAAPLTAGKQYYWYFKVYCQPGAKLLSFVEGWIQRTSLNPAVESQLQNATPQQKVALYASNGIWYEALTAAAELRRTNSSDRNWANLLQDVGLSKIASEAIVEN
ncbi:MAG TPA: hypothetical protein DDW76_04875 [Cyanobacteria bacterium UBA11369]|nr:hypothetical protein [Cyanobacteria bacterium UBA11371]HBE34078.1 hypothetical protein [Cyanobacteria bacterium UBA11368]HBE48140.1 hypothetical protein [Cyanobacteria bacterium UBA11369]